MTKEEKEVLTLLYDSPTNDYVEYVKRYVDYPKSLIEDLVTGFLREKLIQKVKIPQGDKDTEWFYYTNKVTRDMLDDDMRYKRDRGIYLQEEIIYPIEDETESKEIITIKAGKKWVDRNKTIQYEGIKLNVPKSVRNNDKITFAIMNIARGKVVDTFDIWLHAHSAASETQKSECYVDAGGDIETKLTVSKDLLKSWTKLDGREIDNAFGSIKMGCTYNLMITLPRTITLTEHKIIILKNMPRVIDSMNVCNLIFKNKHPIDKRK